MQLNQHFKVQISGFGALSIGGTLSDLNRQAPVLDMFLRKNPLILQYVVIYRGRNIDY